MLNVCGGLYFSYEVLKINIKIPMLPFQRPPYDKRVERDILTPNRLVHCFHHPWPHFGPLEVPGKQHVDPKPK